MEKDLTPAQAFAIEMCEKYGQEIDKSVMFEELYVEVFNRITKFNRARPEHLLDDITLPKSRSIVLVKVKELNIPIIMFYIKHNFLKFENGDFISTNLTILSWRYIYNC